MPMEQDLHVELYTAAMKEEWDAFVDSSRNATFLLRRDYMDYHSDRFTDCSLIIRHGDKPVALLPASRHGSEARLASWLRSPFPWRLDLRRPGLAPDFKRAGTAVLVRNHSVFLSRDGY